MTKYFLFFVLLFFSIVKSPISVSAQSITESVPTASVDNHTQKEEQQGQTIWDNLQSQKINCAQLKDQDYTALGEYFMGKMTGTNHSSMNNMMILMMGEEGEEQMHIVLGKRSSGCIPQTDYKSSVISNMWSNMWKQDIPFPNGLLYNKGGVFNMMGNFGMNNLGWGMFAWGFIFMILIWILIILIIAALIKWIFYDGKKSPSKTPLEILKERYVKGEIDSKEYSQKKREI